MIICYNLHSRRKTIDNYTSKNLKTCSKSANKPILSDLLQGCSDKAVTIMI